VRAFRYVPFSWLLPQVAALAYHGGIGTLAQAVHAKVPQLVVPHGYDQFDNAWRIERLGLGRSLPQRRYRAHHVARTLRAVLEDGPERREALAAKVDGAAMLARTCELLEGLRAAAR
jgi:UDP:flavonoid glycosyltransferase YjiC (YdhE family)